jgi:hypothetical protein
MPLPTGRPFSLLSNRASYDAGRRRLRLPPRRKDARRTPGARRLPTLGRFCHRAPGPDPVCEIVGLASTPVRSPHTLTGAGSVTFLKSQADLHLSHRPTRRRARSGGGLVQLGIMRRRRAVSRLNR